MSDAEQSSLYLEICVLDTPIHRDVLRRLLEHLEKEVSAGDLSAVADRHIDVAKYADAMADYEEEFKAALATGGKG